MVLSLNLSNIFSSDWDKSESVSINSCVTLSNYPKEFRSRLRIKYCEKKEAIQEIFREYCANTSIHGINYIGEEKRPIWERILWMIVFAISILVCSKLFYNIYWKWDSTPMIVTFSEKSTPIWNIPFPAVTLCSETKTISSVFNFSQTYSDFYLNKYENNTINIEDVDLEQVQYMEAMLQICSFDVARKLVFPDNRKQFDYIEKLEEIYPDSNFTYAFCMFRNDIDMCERMNFVRIYTDEGICYTFNGLKPRDLYREKCVQHVNNLNDEPLKWNLEDGYSSDAGTADSYPYRIFGAGRRPSFSMLVQGIDTEFDFLCQGLVQGFKILIHSPDDVPLITKNFIRIPFRKEILISVQPNIIETSAGLRHYLPSRRQCYFKDERQLSFFKIYTQNNCERECLANITLSRCGCVKFSMPRELQTPVCNHSKIECLYNAEDALLRQEFAEGIKTSSWNIRGETKCNCLPACTSLAYDAEISLADFDFYTVLKALHDEHLDEFPGIEIGRFFVFFKETQYISWKRQELYGTADFLANCGGLLALFMGVSAISLLELIYYCTIRLFGNLKMRWRSQKLLLKHYEENVMKEYDNYINI